jgi:type IV fimbrial biogenesis protein FimT
MRTHIATAKGFSILELMVAISVLAVLLATGVPSFVQIIRNNRITAQSNELVSALNVARSESIKRGIPVSVCSSADGATCAGSATWGTGWIVFTDGLGAAGAVNPAVPVETGDEILQVWPAVQGGLQLNSVAGTAPVSVARNFVQYSSTGMPSPIAATNFSLFKSGAPASSARCITVSTAGRISTAQALCP